MLLSGPCCLQPGEAFYAPFWSARVRSFRRPGAGRLRIPQGRSERLLRPQGSPDQTAAGPLHRADRRHRQPDHRQRRRPGGTHEGGRRAQPRRPAGDRGRRPPVPGPAGRPARPHPQRRTGPPGAARPARAGGPLVRPVRTRPGNRLCPGPGGPGQPVHLRSPGRRAMGGPHLHPLLGQHLQPVPGGQPDRPRWRGGYPAMGRGPGGQHGPGSGGRRPRPDQGGGRRRMRPGGW